jgi:ubiquinone/menaquinone biosynthesis C-methylase UbiE
MLKMLSLDDIVGTVTMGQDLEKIETMYDRMAKEYAEAFFEEHEKKPKDEKMLRIFAEALGDKKPVWDFGCGPGQTTKYLTDLGMEISGLDVSEKMIEQARTRYPQIHFSKGNILELEFKDDSIAGIVAFYVICHFTEKQVEKAFREVFRVLRPGGLLLFTYHIGEETIRLEEFLGKAIDIDFMFFTTDFIRCCMEGVGFRNMEITEREPYPEVEYQSRRAYLFASKPGR